MGAGCGKKGAPLPPLQRLPQAPGGLTITRIEGDVYAKFKAPIANVDGATPANVARVELYAITAERAPHARTPELLRKASRLIGSEIVRKPPPPPVPPKEGQPPPPPPPPGPGIDQGEEIVLHEALTPEVETPVDLTTVEEPLRGRLPAVDEAQVPRPLVAPSNAAGAERFYYAVAVSNSGRYGPPTGLIPAPLGPTSSAPGAPEVKVSETSVTIHWTPAGDARGATPPGEPDVLPSKPIIPGPPPTTYDVYEVPGNVSPDAPLAVPTPLTPAPVGALEFTQSPITLGTERCFVVRPVDILNGTHVRGPASPQTCASFADTFPPAPPGRLDAVATPGTISLIWELVDASDLAGYLVLRGEAGSATLAALTPEPIIATSYRDDSVRTGVRYVYAVVAVDKAGNRSAESNRVEETARQ